jgi:hypothetical protein
MQPGDALAFVVLGVTKKSVSDMRTCVEHCIQTGSFDLVRQTGFQQQADSAS